MKNRLVILVLALALTSCASKSSFNSFYADNKKVSNHKIKTQLAVKLKYPTFREGLKSLIAK